MSVLLKRLSRSSLASAALLAAYAALAPSFAGELHLEVFLNGAPTRLIGQFHQLPDGALAARPDELRELGLNIAHGGMDGQDMLRLDALPGVVVAFDGQAQTLHIEAEVFARKAQLIDLAPQPAGSVKPASASGALLNYTLLAGTHSLVSDGARLLKGASGSFEARLFGRYGVVSHSFIAGALEGDLRGMRRLATRWSYSDPQRMLAYTAGDLVTGGLAWTRPMHLGGFQIRRNFAVRPDLVTLPLPSYSGTAAVPSTVEVYAQNTRTFSGHVGEGPFRLVNLPAVAGAGSARIVLRDASGRETEETLPFFASSRLLRKGLLDFSMEAGFARRGFGTGTDEYDRRLVGFVSARYGLSDRLTVEAHAEGGGGLMNGGLGFAFPFAGMGLASLSASASAGPDGTGYQASAGLELAIAGWTLRGYTQRAFGPYEDLAALTALRTGHDPHRHFSAGVPRALDQLAASIPLPVSGSAMSLSFTHLKDARHKTNRILGLTYTQRLSRRGNFFASGFLNMGQKSRFGLFAGISFSLDGGVTASSGFEQGRDGGRLVSRLSRQEAADTHGFGWQLVSAEGRRPERSATLTHRGRYGRGEATLREHGGDFGLSGQFEGAVAIAGGGVFVTRRLEDAFAVVDAGMPGIPIHHQNRLVGYTNAQGRLLLPDLVAFEDNTISIDPSGLPIDVDIQETSKLVAPAERSGVVVSFGASERPRAALVGFVDAQGLPLPVSAVGHLQATKAEFVVGYDGMAYLVGLASENTTEITLPGGAVCEAHFAYRERPGTQPRLENVPCL
ncbi:fimbria/pilus outer membrane usher protein [Nitratireductor indicus]|uniref:fimbria/pilus outer membrane usher protein n=1 Tax=Nitratireductor indicus TaxID=721133 RepID=UPI0028753395|nr:fimbria/pilus outer membrane usher protein [Nitratireductor indicus]MDS1135134.1 fimbria/pilus outer membrane usher protein [Nitratireductor indicus]